MIRRGGWRKLSGWRINKIEMELKVVIEEKKQKDNAEPVSKYQWLFDWWPLLAVALLIICAFGSYAFVFVSPHFPDCDGRWDENQCVTQSLADAKSSWGQLGDYMGGSVNPLIGLLTIVLLVRSLRQNEKALKLSRDELEQTRLAVEQATTAQKNMELSLQEQLKEAKSQNNFANYYKHLDLFENYVGRQVAPAAPIPVTQLRLLHSVLFQGAAQGKFHSNVDLVKIALELALEILIAIKEEAEKEPHLPSLDSISSLVGNSLQKLRIQTKFSIDFSEDGSKLIYASDGGRLMLMDGQLQGTILALAGLYGTLNIAYNFDPKSTDLFDYFAKLLREISPIFPSFSSDLVEINTSEARDFYSGFHKLKHKIAISNDYMVAALIKNRIKEQASN